jgi:putative membrane protein insertion efficiency factor
MGHCNSSAQVHDASSFCVDRSGVAGAAAESSQVKVASFNVAAARSVTGGTGRTADSFLHGRPMRKSENREEKPPAISLGMTAQTFDAAPHRRSASRVGVWLLLGAIRFYQAVFAPVMPLGCKFYPSCSHYAAEAIARYGAIRGARLALARLWRCRPFTQGGVDPVPDTDELLSKRSENGTRSEVRW